MIAAASLRSSMDPITREQTKCKFNITYTITKETIEFTKMKIMCELEGRHGFDLGQGCKNPGVCVYIVYYVMLIKFELCLTL